MNILIKTTLPFTILGAINWGLIGIFDFNLVTQIFQDMKLGIQITYILIAICGIIDILVFFIDLKKKKDKQLEQKVEVK